MSTLPVTVSPSRPPSHQPPEDRYRIVLLYIETLALIVLLGVLIFILGNWVLPTSSRNIVHFGVLFGTSAVALLGSILSAAQARRLLVQVFHLFLHIPVLVELRRIAYVTVVLPEWTFSNVLPALGSMLDFVVVISFVHGVLYLVHKNMVHGVERSDSGGVLVLHVVCRWIRGWISVAKSHRRSQGEADPDSVSLESIGKFGWLSPLINTQHRLQVRASSPDSDEETIMLLSINDPEKLV